MKRLVLGAAFAAALGLSACATPGGLEARGDSAEALEAYRIYRAHCDSVFGWPFTATVTCSKTPREDEATPAEQAKLIAEVVAKTVAQVLAASAGAPPPESPR